MSAGDFQQKQIEAGFARENQLRLAAAETEERIVGIKDKQLNQGKDAASEAKLQIDYQNQIAKIMLSVPFGPLTEASQKQVDNAAKLLSVETALLGIENSRTKQSKLLSQQQDTAKQSEDFLLEVGSGEFIKNFQKEQREDQLRENARQQLEEFRAAKEAGIPIGPVAEAELRKADRIAARAGTSIQALLKADFKNLLELSKYDFSGLQPLSGLTLSIQ